MKIDDAIHAIELLIDFDSYLKEYREKQLNFLKKLKYEKI